MNTPMIKLVVSICMIAFLLSGCQPQKEPIGIAELTQIIKKRDLELVEYKYNETIFLYKNDNRKKKIRFIVKFPVTVSASLDLKTIEVDSVNGKILLSRPMIKAPVIYFADERTEIIKVNDGLVLRNGRTEILETLQNRIRETKERIRENAVSLGILTQAEEEARKFISDLLRAFNLENTYAIVFEEVETPRVLEAISSNAQLEEGYFIEFNAEINE